MKNLVTIQTCLKNRSNTCMYTLLLSGVIDIGNGCQPKAFAIIQKKSLFQLSAEFLYLFFLTSTGLDFYNLRSLWR